MSTLYNSSTCVSVTGRVQDGAGELSYPREGAPLGGEGGLGTKLALRSPRCGGLPAFGGARWLVQLCLVAASHFTVHLQPVRRLKVLDATAKLAP